MALPLPSFPNVPDLPGVPPVARMVGTNVGTAAALILTDLFHTPAQEQWGIIDDKFNFLVLADSVISLDIDRDMDVSDYPVEKGTFATYNKVRRPFTGTVVLAKGGDLAARKTFLEQINTVTDRTKTVYILVPESSYGPVTIEGHQYGRHASQGRSLITAHLRFKQIRIIPPKAHNAPATTVPASAQTSDLTSTGLPDPYKVQNPAAAAMAPLGQVQPGTTSLTVLSAFNAQPAV